MEAGPRVADLRPRYQRWTIVEARCRGGAADALGDVLVNLVFLIRTGPKALDRGHDQARIELLDSWPRKSHAIERAGREILDQDIAIFDEILEDSLSLRYLGIEGDRALVMVQHREVEAVRIGHIAQLHARHVTDARLFTLMTSAPNHARSCVQVGPDWTCVKSRMRMPSSALPIVFSLLAFSFFGSVGCAVGQLARGFEVMPFAIMRPAGCAMPPISVELWSSAFVPATRMPPAENPRHPRRAGRRPKRQAKSGISNTRLSTTNATFSHARSAACAVGYAVSASLRCSKNLVTDLLVC